MSGSSPIPADLRNLLDYGDLSFHDFMEIALYHPGIGYYMQPGNPVGEEGDFVTSAKISPVFGFAIAGLIREFVRQTEGEVSAFVDIGCGDGSLIHQAWLASEPDVRERMAFLGVDRSFSRLPAGLPADLQFLTDVAQIPRGVPLLLFSNELFDAFPFARLVQRGDDLHELFVRETPEGLDWSEYEAPAGYSDYFAGQGIALADGQFADVSLEWGAYYRDLAAIVERGLLVTIDYGFPRGKLFHPRIRRFGTAAAFRAHRVTRDLLATPGRQDLTAHINFDDLIAAGESSGLTTLFFDRQARFLLSLGITDHPLLQPLEEGTTGTMQEAVDLAESRDAARRLVLPDGIGEEMRVLVQARRIRVEGWGFQRKLF
jgi:SAM-dependent MidA family methyltransferase